jgi:tetratricopeptide (TPR) repeat protein
VIELLLAAENDLALGRLDHAARTYRQVLEADPRNGIAAAGLSRVALERGDDAGALDLARAALEIDPENATARRMIARLEEVAEYRAAAAAAGPAAPASAPVGTPIVPGPVSDRVVDPARIPAPTPVLAQAAPPVTPSRPAPSGPAPARRGLLRRILRRS